MKVLHVGWGFQPFRMGGLIAYAEDLMEIQVKKGYQVTYFCTGRFLIRSKKPFIKKWKNTKGYTVYEEWNPPVISGFENGIENPVADITEQTTESLFLDIVKQVAPDIIHIQEFLGFPTSLITKIKRLNIKIIYTVEDYYYLCPTIRLILPDGKLCRLKDEQLGKQCAICCRNAPKNNLIYKLKNVYPAIFNPKTVNFIQSIKKVMLNKPAVSRPVAAVHSDEQKINDFNRRRDYNLDVLSEVDLIIAMSHRVAEILSDYKPLNNMITLNLTLRHIDDLQPKEIAYAGIDKIRFGLINVLSAPIKGRDLLMELFAMIEAAEWKHQIEFTVMGRVDDADKLMISRYKFVQLTGRFNAADLDNMLDKLGINVGIIPSVWEEAYGFVGMEFLAKGIPVIGNQIGGITDYVTDETGWLNTTCDSNGLFYIVSQLVKSPESIAEKRKNLVNNRDKYVKSIATHFNEMDVIYRNLLGNVVSIN